MYKISVLGSGIGYTASPAVHGAIAAATGVEIACDAVDISDADLGETVKRLFAERDGFFVTKPFKFDIGRYIGSPAFGAVNVVRSRDRAAENTDGSGFMHALDRNFVGWRDRVESALVLGAGGGAWAVTSALKAVGVNVYVLNRSAVPAAKLCAATGCELYANQKTELAVNCTSVGADGDILRSLCVIPRFEYAFDLAYRGETPFLAKCRDGGSLVANGYDMLVYQAIEGDLLLLNRQADVNGVFETVDCILERNGG